MRFDEAREARLVAYLEKKIPTISNADPATLIKYIVALIKKGTDKQQCNSKLRDFFSDSTESVVNKIFDLLASDEVETWDSRSSSDSYRHRGDERGTGGSSGGNIRHSSSPDRDYKHRNRSDEERGRSSRKRRSDDHYDDDRHTKRRREDDEDAESYRRSDGSPDRVGTAPGGRNRRNERDETDYDGGRGGHRDARRGGGPGSDRRGGSNGGSGGGIHAGGAQGPPPPAAQGILGIRPTQRCRNYDEVGVCLDGDACPYEHGPDRVKVEDPNIVRSLQRTAESNGYDPERALFPRNPADAMFPPLAGMPGQLWQPENQPTVFPPYLGALQLPLGMPPPPYLVPPNNSTIGGPGGIGGGPGGSGGRGRGGPRNDSRGRGGNQGVGIELMGPGRRFTGDRTHDGGPPRPKHDPSNTTLMITSIPKELNSISQLNSHFSQFGTIVNIQVMQSSNKALVQFSTHQEALAGLRSTEAVLGNRFIRILWANKDDELEAPNSIGTAALSGRPAPGPRSTVPPSGSSSIHPASTSAPRTETASSSTRPLGTSTTAPAAGSASAPSAPASLATASSAAIISAAKAQRSQEARSVLQQKDKLRKQLLEQQASLLEFMTKATSPAVKAQLKEQFDQVTQLLEAALEKEKSALDSKKAGAASAPSSAPAAPSATAAATAAAAPKRAALTSSKEREKQLLDKELEILAESQSPADDRLKALQSELASLEKEASSYGIPTDSPRSKFAGRGRGGFAPRGAARGRGSRSLDLRPTTLVLYSLPAELSSEAALRSHFGASVSSVEFDGTATAVVHFATRKAAEIALTTGNKFQSTPLQISWHTPSSAPPTQASSAAATVELYKGTQEEQEEEGEEEEKEDDDDDEEGERSWKR